MSHSQDNNSNINLKFPKQPNCSIALPNDKRKSRKTYAKTPLRLNGSFDDGTKVNQADPFYLLLSHHHQ